VSNFKFTTQIQPRYGDFDMLGHLNNASYMVYFELARIEYFHQVGWSLNDISNVVAHFDIDFLIPVLPYTAITCSVKTISLGSKSFQMQYELNSEQGNVCHCRAHSVQVCIDKKNGKAIHLPGNIRDILTNFEGL